MRIVVPYTVRNEEVASALRASTRPGDSVAFEPVAADLEAYWRALARWWTADDDLVVVEHDVVIRPDILHSFDNCPEPWCVFGYADMCHEECLETWANMLGCTRFRKELIAATPDCLSSITDERVPPPPHPQAQTHVRYNLRDWPNLCDSIAGNKIGGLPAPLRPGSLRAAGYTHHWHKPHVEHHPWGIEENRRRLGRGD